MSEELFPGRARPRQILTPDVMQTIPQMIESGMNRNDIAAVLGCTKNTLQVQCSRQGVSLRQNAPQKYLTLTAVVLTEAAMIKLQARALESGVNEQVLASRLLEVIAQDNLFDAVLDEGGT